MIVYRSELPLEQELAMKFDRLVKNLFGELKTVIDIGACRGSFTLAAARRGALVLAVEPNVQELALLLARARKEGLESNVIPVCAAVWHESGQVLTLSRHIGGNFGQVSSLYRFGVTPFFATTITLAQVFDLLPGKIDLLKIDIEGAEHLLFQRGQDQRFLRAARYLHFETHDVTESRYFVAGLKNLDIASILRRLGYRPVRGEPDLYKQEMAA